MDIDDELKIILNSLRMLPPWREGDFPSDWWREFSSFSRLSLQYLGEKLSWITNIWARDPTC